MRRAQQHAPPPLSGSAVKIRRVVSWQRRGAEREALCEPSAPRHECIRLGRHDAVARGRHRGAHSARRLPLDHELDGKKNSFFCRTEKNGVGVLMQTGGSRLGVEHVTCTKWRADRCHPVAGAISSTCYTCKMVHSFSLCVLACVSLLGDDTVSALGEECNCCCDLCVIKLLKIAIGYVVDLVE